MSRRPEPALALALRYLGAAERTEAELRSYLTKRKVDVEEAEQVVAYCMAKRFVSDERAADRETELAKTRNLDGRLKVAAKLQRRGIAEVGLDRAMADYPESEEVAAAGAWIRAKKFTDPAKAARYLASKGYSEEAARTALTDAFPDLDF